ncbi:hypothetical protein HOLleu_21668 [Holothuria leucospilota]|uniref:Ig-like domain-containing protein n=1 Tax=Holothuria leucospilota TaxID=206669 RepID=A0A9Q1H6Z0_HOLLE|nr:hypothetical protein HOLleu_21668 [Holothuria leucospilota]
MMGINVRILLPFLIFYDIEVSSAQTVRDVVTYTTKPVEEFRCHFNTSVAVQWTENQDGGGTIVLFTYVSATGKANKEATDEKYNNFDYLIDQESNSFNLLISNVDKDDGGRYLCNPISEPTVTFDVNVEVIPASISINCTASNTCTSFAEREVAAQIVCVCMATGISSEMLKIKWEGVDAPTTNNSSSVTDLTSGTISSETTLPAQHATSSISCLLTGYKSQIPEGLISYTYRFSPPVCNLVHECPSDSTSAVLTCNCSDGSPKISAYSFYNNQMSPIGTQFYSSSTLKVETDGKDTFYCSGCNGVMHDQFAEHAFNCQQETEVDKDADTDDKILKNGSAPWWIFIVILLFIGGGAIIIFVVVKKKKKRPSKSGVDVERNQKKNDEATKRLMPGSATNQKDDKVQDPKQLIDNDIPEYAIVNKQRLYVNINKGNNSASSGGGKAPKVEKQEKEGADVSKGNDDNEDRRDKVLYSNMDEENQASPERLQPEGQETTVNGQSENDLGSNVDSGKREVATKETPAGSQHTSHPAPSAEQYGNLPQRNNDSDPLVNHVPVDVFQPPADLLPL